MNNLRFSKIRILRLKAMSLESTTIVFVLSSRYGYPVTAVPSRGTEHDSYRICHLTCQSISSENVVIWNAEEIKNHARRYSSNTRSFLLWK
ncbi:hypothetical protein HOLleu_06376 [Holothuria leucospilota]|uniref:Uncharacterized protein n=1 Tax=Holothuria leucospilota TaxID=206669 RepID=A0A9Q1CMZ7_HOLLE|nr:hypothetical protein HOLleu_06376 [Holothuria leucospilota]